jgi:Carboxypeptidase regulatory-like domain
VFLKRGRATVLRNAAPAWARQAVVASVFACGALHPVGLAQHAPVGVSVSGVVQVGDSATPVPYAVVFLGRAHVLCDAKGRFVFEDVPPGTVELVAMKGDYLGGHFGQMSPWGSGVPLSTAAGERLAGVVLRLWKTGVIAGEIRDDQGQPAMNMVVQALHLTAVGNRPVLAQTKSTTTNDLGQYRLSGLRPGRYAVAVSTFSMTDRLVREAADEYPTTYFPGVFDASAATLVAVGTGGEDSGVDIQLTRPGGAVAGTVAGPGAGSVELRLVPVADGGTASGLATARTLSRPDGSFTFQNVPRGLYEIRVLVFPSNRNGALRAGGVILIPHGATPAPLGATVWAEVPIDVGDRPRRDVRVVLRDGARFRGEVIFEGSLPRPSRTELEGVPILVERLDQPLDNPTPLSVVAPDGTFMTAGLPNGRYFVSPMLLGLQGWTLLSVQSGGRDVSGKPIELRDADVTDVVFTFTDRPTSLSGYVSDDRGMRVAGASVYAFPTDRELWAEAGSQSPMHIVNTTSVVNGAYHIAGLPPGRYFVATRPGGPPEGWGTAHALAAMATTSVVVQLQPGQHVARNLTVTGHPPDPSRNRRRGLLGDGPGNR